jgi:hypothetical protein
MSDQSEAFSAKNLTLWDRVAVTDPDFTKSFSSMDGFNGTAVSPIYNVRKATHAFGPVGIGWGYEIVDERYINGVPLGFDSEGNMWGHVIIHVLRLKLWYMIDGKRGEVTHFGQTTFVGKGEHGLYTDEDAPKKSLTDALGKCLSMLGFSADVYLGHYDDSKYVAALQEKFKDKSKTGTPPLTAQRLDASPADGPASKFTSSTGGNNPGKTSDPAAWIERVRSFHDDGHIEHARKEVPKYLKGDDLKRVREEIDRHQLATWLTRIPLLSRANLPSFREKAQDKFKDEALNSVLKAIDDREATFAALKPVATAAAA